MSDSIAKITIDITDRTVSYEASVNDQQMPVPEIVFWLEMTKQMIMSNLAQEPTNGE